jgi:hypothetical protein
MYWFLAWWSIFEKSDGQLHFHRVYTIQLKSFYFTHWNMRSSRLAESTPILVSFYILCEKNIYTSIQVNENKYVEVYNKLLNNKCKSREWHTKCLQLSCLLKLHRVIYDRFENLPVNKIIHGNYYRRGENTEYLERCMGGEPRDVSPTVFAETKRYLNTRWFHIYFGTQWAPAT